jgi:hypothetical protein
MTEQSRACRAARGIRQLRLCAGFACCLACGGKGSSSDEPAGQANGGSGPRTESETASGSSDAPGDAGAELPAAQAVFWFGLGAVPAAACPSGASYQYPSDARATISGNSAEGERVLDGGDHRVECTVRRLAGSEGDYAVSLSFQSGAIGSFFAGTPSLSSSTTTQPTFDVSLSTAQLSVTQRGCTADVQTVTDGAIWLRNLYCDGLRDPSAPAISCTGQGGVIFENCLR